MKRASGVLMHLSSLFGDYSCGSFGKNAIKFIDFLHESGFSYWQTLPFCVPDSVGSPYKSFSAFSGNWFFIDLETLHEKGLITLKELESEKNSNPYSCDFEKLNLTRLSLLKKASKRFKEVDKMNEFYLSHEKVLEFCKFITLKEQNSFKPFTEWKILEIDEELLNSYKFIEYEFFVEWLKIKSYANSKGVKIIGDIPMYVDYDSSDVYYNKSQFLLDENYKPKKVAGVPPDYFSKDGQLWGNPLYDIKKMREDGFSWWKERILFISELFDGIRIDHFRAFESYYAIPYGDTTAKNGKWQKGGGTGLINAIKSVSKDKLLICEDLGDITEKVIKLVKKSALPNMRVLQFAFLGDKNSPHLPHNYSNNCVAYTGTHDNNTLLGYIWEQSEENRRRIFDYFNITDGNLDNSYYPIIKEMLKSHAGLVIIPIQDLLKFGSDTRLNTPGTSSGNWTFRITEEQFNTLDKSLFKSWNELYGRI